MACGDRSSFPENEIHGQYQACHAPQMAEPKGLGFEDHPRERDENDQGHRLLDHFQLHQRERPAIPLVTLPVGRNLRTVLEKGNPPTEENTPQQANMLG
ncbi:MAG: hypothetical protein RLY31_149 [Bacteroidota bacterium]